MPPRRPSLAGLRAGVEQVEVDVKALDVAYVSRAGHLRRLDHPRPGAARRLGAEGGTLVAVELEQAEPDVIAGGDDLPQRCVDEHAADLDVADAARPRSAAPRAVEQRRGLPS